MNQCGDGVGALWQIFVFVFLNKLVIVLGDFFLVQRRDYSCDNFFFGSVFNDDCGGVDDA